MKKFLKNKKELNLLLITTFLFQAALFFATQESHALRPPSQFSLVEEAGAKEGKKIISSEDLLLLEKELITIRQHTPSIAERIKLIIDPSSVLRRCCMNPAQLSHLTNALDMLNKGPEYIEIVERKYGQVVNVVILNGVFVFSGTEAAFAVRVNQLSQVAKGIVSKVIDNIISTKPVDIERWRKFIRRTCLENGLIDLDIKDAISGQFSFYLRQKPGIYKKDLALLNQDIEYGMLEIESVVGLMPRNVIETLVKNNINNRLQTKGQLEHQDILRNNKRASIKAAL